PGVAVRIGEEDERVPGSARPIRPISILDVSDGAGVHAPLDQLGPGGLDVADHELQTLRGTRRGIDQPGSDGDRAGRPRRGQLNHAKLLARLAVDVDDEADLLAVEPLRPIAVRRLHTDKLTPPDN